MLFDVFQYLIRLAGLRALQARPQSALCRVTTIAQTSLEQFPCEGSLVAAHNELKIERFSSALGALS